MTTKKYLYAETTGMIIGAAFAVHNSLGIGLTEKTYENALVLKLQQLGMTVGQQESWPVFFENQKVGKQDIDLVVDEKVVVETKAVKRLLKGHETQLLGYLRNTKFQVGLLINFGASVEVRRFIPTQQNK